jgi:hypothetical protein
MSERTADERAAEVQAAAKAKVKKLCGGGGARVGGDTPWAEKWLWLVNFGAPHSPHGLGRQTNAPSYMCLVNTALPACKAPLGVWPRRGPLTD